MNRSGKTETYSYSLRLLSELPHFTQEAIFRDGLRLDATFAH
jgi:hypothetical protein